MTRPSGEDNRFLLTQETLLGGAVALRRRESFFGEIVDRFGSPPLFRRPAGFPTLLHIILEQQVSLASAKAAFDRLQMAVEGTLTPTAFLTFDDPTLKSFGFSRQKTRYGRILAEAIRAGALDLDGLVNQPDDDVRAILTSLTGIGPWTADVYLLMALGRPDIWPAGDLALKAALVRWQNLPQRPSTSQMVTLADAWRPLRSTAAHLLWHAYLSER